MEVYHQPVTPTDTTARVLRPYEYVVRPPIARLLIAIRQHCGVGGTIRPGVRQLAAWMNYASAGRIAPLLAQLAMDGWILYDGSTGTITLLADADGAITHCDQEATTDDEHPITDGDQEAITDGDRPIPDGDRPRPITFRDRVKRRQEAIHYPITPRDRFEARMVDHDLAAADHDLDSAAAHENLPCAAESITPSDRLCAASQAAVLRVMVELGAEPAVVADALARRPDYTPEQVRDLYAWCQRRIQRSEGALGEGIFFHALRAGQLAPPSAAPAAPPDWHKYTSSDDYGGLFRLGSDTSDLDLVGGAP